MIEFDWLTSLFSKLPESPKLRKTIFDIAGFPRWENVNSNTLAFYLDENEEHGFGRLFFNSLLQILIERKAIPKETIELYETNYTVERETYADTKRIDILIKSVEESLDSNLWVIIIENKLYANIYNDLSFYWQTIKAQNKTGIVISLNDNRNGLLQLEKSKGIKFHNILHQDLVKVVLGQISNYYLLSDDRHLLILKDYFQNISNMTQNIDSSLREKQWKLYRQYAEQIENLKELENDLKDYTVKSFFYAMDKFGFSPATSYSNTKGKHFYTKQDFFETAGLKHPKYFRFYFWYEDLVPYHAISVYFELYGEYTKFGPTIKTKLREKYTPPYPFSIGINGGIDYEYFHLIVCDNYKFIDDRPLQEQISQMFQQVFFNDQFNVVQKCTEWVEAEMSAINPNQ